MPKQVKIALSVLAALVLAFGSVTTIGEWLVPPAVSELFMSAGPIFAWLGVTPWVVPAPVAQALATGSIVLSGFVASHAASWGDGKKHVGLIVVALIAALMGVLGRFRAPAAAPPAAPAPAP